MKVRGVEHLKNLARGGVHAQIVLRGVRHPRQSFRYECSTDTWEVGGEARAPTSYPNTARFVAGETRITAALAIGALHIV